MSGGVISRTRSICLSVCLYVCLQRYSLNLKYLCFLLMELNQTFWIELTWFKGNVFLGVQFMGPCQGHVWTILKSCFAQFQFHTRQSYGSTWFIRHVHTMFNLQELARAIFGPYQGHVQSTFRTRQSRILKFSGKCTVVLVYFLFDFNICCLFVCK